jgi:hypothetical protein
MNMEIGMKKVLILILKEKPQTKLISGKQPTIISGLLTIV